MLTAPLTVLLFLLRFGCVRCVSALHLDTLNKQRAMLLVRSFMAGRYDEMRPERVSKKVMRSSAVLRFKRGWLHFF